MSAFHWCQDLWCIMAENHELYNREGFKFLFFPHSLLSSCQHFPFCNFFSISAFSPPPSLVGWLNHPPFQQKPVACLSPCGLLPKSLCRPPPLPSSHSGRITIYPFSTIQLLFNDCFQWRRTVDKLCPTHCDALEQLKENENSMTFWKKATIWSVGKM